jgi:ATP adenylyltransferase
MIMTDRVEPASDFAGEPDSYGRLWAPHRAAYLAGENKPSHSEAGEDCPFCTTPQRTDEDGLIVARGESVFVVCNLYPYNNGHVMVVPYRHVADYTELTAAETTELAAFTQHAMRTLRAALHPHGFNIGLNQGPIAGAGIPGHLHQHVVPRWGGDTNFIPVIAHTRVLSQLLADVRAQLAASWAT